tara:strand:+ start:453 stop:1049 length:597 start_codon:yes stop_codon:yes gene_type:complete
MMYHNKLSLNNLQNEKWIDALGFDGIYEVSNYGRIKSLGRYVNIRNGQRWVKERIRKQCLIYDRMTCPLNMYGKKFSINVSAIIFLSWYPNISYNPKTHCVVHKDKVQSNNVLSNLKIDTITNSHKLNAKKGLLPHLEINNKKKSDDYNKLTHKICGKCHIKKKLQLFEYGRNKCRKCKSEAQKERYRNKIKEERLYP